VKNITSTRTIGLITVLAIALAGVLLLPDQVLAQTPEECWFTPAHDTVLFAAPVFTVTQQIGVARGGESYAVTAQAPDYLLIGLDAETQGYVKRNQGTLSGTCQMNIPVISVPLAAHPTLCVLNTAAQPVPLFVESTLQTQHDTLPANASYALIQKAGASYYVYVDEYSGGWVSTSAGTISGACDVLPGEPMIYTATAIALQHARLWSAPDIYQGTVLVTLEPGTQVAILAGPVRGPISYSSALAGDWYQARWNSVVGWVWSERVTFTSESPVPDDTALALPNARAWSQPNVKTGQMLVAIPAGISLQIIAGPVSGPIRYDTDATGDWYQVSLNGTVLGWVWVDRLAFDTQ